MTYNHRIASFSGGLHVKISYKYYNLFSYFLLDQVKSHRPQSWRVVWLIGKNPKTFLHCVRRHERAELSKCWQDWRVAAKESGERHTALFFKNNWHKKVTESLLKQLQKKVSNVYFWSSRNDEGNDSIFCRYLGIHFPHPKTKHLYDRFVIHELI